MNKAPLLLCATLPFYTQYSHAKTDDTALATIEVKATQTGSRPLLLNEHSSLNRFTLKHNRSNTLGETISKIAGIHNSSFGPSSGLPVIRSLSGNRVSILNNQLDVSDMAGISGNLPTPIEPFFAQEIEIEKTSSAVLYGSRALGGSINVIDNRIPHTQPTNSIIPNRSYTGALEVRGGLNTATSQLLRLDGSIGNHIAYHLDGMNSHSNNLDIPGRNKAPVCYDKNSIYTSGVYAGVDSTLARLCQVNADIDSKPNPAYYQYININGEYTNSPDYLISQPPFYIPNQPNPDYVPGTPNTEYLLHTKRPITDISPSSNKTLPNSQSTRHQFAAGLSYIGQNGYIGLGVNRFLTHYGVPGYAAKGSQTSNGLAPVGIRSGNTRWTLEGEYRPEKSPISRITLSMAQNQNQNSEYLGHQLANSLNAHSQQIRFSMEHRQWHHLTGMIGLDWKNRHITTAGTDRYMPNVNTREYGIFWLETLKLDPFTAQLGWRTGAVRHQVSKDFDTTDIASKHLIDRNFHLNQKYLALQWQIHPQLQLRWQHTISQHAPEVNELYSGGAHFSMLRYEKGLASIMEPETSHSNNISLDWQSHGFNTHLAWYHTHLNHYTYPNQTGLSRKGLPIIEWKQDSQKITGLEAEVRYHWQQPTGNYTVRLFADIVKSRATGEARRQRFEGNYLPSLPTNRYGIGLEWQNSHWQLATSLTRYTPQKNRGNYFRESTEPAMSGYTLLDAYLSYRQIWQSHEIEWYAEGKNLTNAEARPYNSPLKYLAPSAGRSLTLGMKLSF